MTAAKQEHNAGEVAELAEFPKQGKKRRVLVPLFPLHEEVRHLLRVLSGQPQSNFTSLLKRVNELRGTPQEPQDWSKPDEWIPERLSGPDQDMARSIWMTSGHAVNPRHIFGHWYLIRRYKLLEEDAQGTMHLTAHGKDFIGHPEGDTVKTIDHQDGLVRLLAIVAEKGPGKRGDFLAEWSAYLRTISNISRDSVFKDTLRRRLLNLRSRSLVVRSGNTYEITPKGLDHLGQVRQDETTELSRLYRLANIQRKRVRDQLKEFLRRMNPFQFEHLIRRLLEEMGYENVEVTSPTNDKGVDVVADIELGITSVREVIQVKRHRGNIGRQVLDQLRGSLHRFNAVRGTIISTGGFSKGTEQAAFEHGASPITLIDGQKLLNLLIEYSLGVRKRSIEMLELDQAGLQEEETS